MKTHILIFAVLLSASAYICGDDLNGRVVDSEGKPIANSRIDIAIAAPKIGKGIFCPSCYADCRKSTTSGADGRFVISGLDPRLKFRLLATSVEKQSLSSSLIDPLDGETTLVLKDFPKDLPASRLLTGKVVDDAGVPIPAALIELVGAKTQARQSRNSVNGDSAVSNDDGEFKLVLGDDYLGVDVQVTAEGSAGARKAMLTPGISPHEIVVPKGASLRGTIVENGRAQPFRPVAIVQTNRLASDGFKKAIPTTTDALGKFNFDSLPGDQQYAIYSPVEASGEKRVIATRLFRVGANGSTKDLGSLETVPAMRLVGQIRMRDNGPLPADLRIALGRLPAWDSVEAELKSDGTFSVENLPPESYEIRFNGNVVLSRDMHHKYQVLSTKSFGVRLDSSTKELEVILDNAKPSDLVRSGGRSKISRDAKGPQSLKGKVIDANGEPVAGIRIGAQLHENGMSLSAQAFSGKDGSFLLRDLPDAAIDLRYHDPTRKGYPLGENAISILYPGIYSAVLNEDDIRLLYDEKLSLPFASIDQ